LSWIAGSEGSSRRGSGKGFVLLMGTSVETILQISVNYLEYKSAYLGVANSSQGRLASVTVFQQKGERNGNGSVPTRAGPRQKAVHHLRVRSCC
jgi:hypothetical protein